MTLALIALSAIGFAIFEFRAISLARNLKKLESAWPQFEELYISALQSGISISDAFSYARDFSIKGLEPQLNELVKLLDRGSALDLALRDFGKSLKLRQAHLFVEIVTLAHQTGSQNLVSSLIEHAKSVRAEITASGNISARNGAILGVAKLGLLAPWVLFIVLSVNEGNRETFNTLAGSMVLLGGFSISLLAYQLVSRAGRQVTLPSVFGNS